MNPKTYEYEAVIQKVPDQDGAYVAFPYDLKAEFSKGRIKVHATFDGESYDGSVVNMGVKHTDGSVCYIIGYYFLPERCRYCIYDEEKRK